jgi:hypothetical protein
MIHFYRSSPSLPGVLLHPYLFDVTVNQAEDLHRHLQGMAGFRRDLPVLGRGWSFADRGLLQSEGIASRCYGRFII